MKLEIPKVKNQCWNFEWEVALGLKETITVDRPRWDANKLKTGISALQVWKVFLYFFCKNIRVWNRSTGTYLVMSIQFSVIFAFIQSKFT